MLERRPPLPGGIAPGLLVLSLLALPSCSPLPTPSSGRGGGLEAVPDILSRRWAPRRTRPPHEILALRGGSMPGLGFNTDLIDKLMTPDMIRGAANMMSNMDPGVLSSMMSMTGMPLGVDPAEAKRAAEELRHMSTQDIQAMKSSAFNAPFPGAPVSAGVQCLRGALCISLPVPSRVPGAPGGEQDNMGKEVWECTATKSKTWVFEQIPPAAEELVRRAEGLKHEGNELHVNKHYEAAVGKYALAKA
jgi:hypothetical protein